MKVLIYGAGQLAQMLALSGVPLGIHCWAYDVRSKKVLDPISKADTGLNLQQAIDSADVLTAEFEHISDELLVQAQASGKLKPSREAILTGGDRVREKALLDKLDIANSPHQVLTQAEQLPQAVQALGLPLVLKTSLEGYDGYGQWRIKQTQDIAKVQAQLTEHDLNANPVIAEQFVPFSRELSLVGARAADGQIRCYPLVENHHYHGQLHLTLAPAAAITEVLQQQAEQAFLRFAEALDYVGVMALEFFQVGEQLLVNEFAPRVHNSGHWSQQGAGVSQFEQHLRAVCGLPLGDARVQCSTAMLNMIGVSQNYQQVLAHSGCHLHWYGKDYRAKRKMGHLNVTAESGTQLWQTLAELAALLPADEFPDLHRLLGERQA